MRVVASILCVAACGELPPLGDAGLGQDGGSVDASVADAETPDARAPPVPLVTGFAVETSTESTLAAWAVVETRTAVAVEIAVTSTASVERRSRRSAPATSHRLPLVALHPRTEYTLRAIADPDGAAESSAPLAFTTGSLPAGLPNLALDLADPSRVAPGITFFGAGLTADPSRPLFVGVDEAGRVVWYWTPDRTMAQVTPELRPLPGGELLLLLENELRVIDVMGRPVRSLHVDYHHDALPLGDHFLVLGRETRTVDVPDLGGEVGVVGDTILEVDGAGDTVWRWSAFDHLDATRFPDALSRTLVHGVYDWTHANALLLDDEGRSILISLRHQHWIVKIDRSSGDVVWRLGPEGDFTLAGGEWFYAQHAPELRPGGQLLVYDNGTARPGGEEYSRAALYGLDPGAGSAVELWSYRTPHFTHFIGDVDTLPDGHILVTAGGIRDGPPQAQLIEVTEDPAPVEVWRLSLSALVYRATRIADFR